jgi:hypothetical protein
MCGRSDDALDALIAAMVARAAAVGLCEPVATDQRRAAQVEGWIALPSPRSLEQLPGALADCRKTSGNSPCRGE